MVTTSGCNAILLLLWTPAPHPRGGEGTFCHTAQSSGQEGELIRAESIGPSLCCVAWVPEGRQEGRPETHSIQSRAEGNFRLICEKKKIQTLTKTSAPNLSQGCGSSSPPPHTLTSQVPRVGQLPWFPQRTLCSQPRMALMAFLPMWGCELDFYPSYSEHPPGLSASLSSWL